MTGRGERSEPLSLLEIHSPRPAGFGFRYGLGKRPTRGRKGRARQLEYLRQFSVRGGARTCMHPVGAMVDVAMTTDGCAHLSGVQRCGSVAACPECAPTIRALRAAEITEAVEKWVADGNSVFMVTVTIPHKEWMKLSETLDVVQSAWSAMWSRKAGQTLNGRLGKKHSVRVLEVTYGPENGWHPHIHALLFCEGRGVEADAEVDQAEVEAHRLIGDRWRKAVGHETWTAADGRTGQWRVPTWANGCLVERCEAPEKVGEYLSKMEYKDGVRVYLKSGGKWGPGQEIANADHKNAGPGRYTPWDLLGEAAEGDAECSRLYREYEEAMKGRSVIMWSRGAKQALGIVEVSDEEAATVEAADVWWAGEIEGGDYVRMRRDETWATFVDQLSICSWLVLGLNRLHGHEPPPTWTGSSERQRALTAQVERSMPAECGDDSNAAYLRRQFRKHVKLRELGRNR